MSLEELMKVFCFANPPESDPDNEHLCDNDPDHLGEHHCGCGRTWL